MSEYDDCQIICSYEDAIILKNNINLLNVSDSFKKGLQKTIDYSEEKYKLSNYLNILCRFNDAGLNAFHVQNLAEFRENGGNYVYSNGNEFESFIESEKLAEDDIKIFSGFFTDRFDPDEYEWSAILISPSINLIAITYGGNIVKYSRLKENMNIAIEWNEFKRKA